ncbi:glyoxylase I family protein [Paramicrobacterium humi]|uniref:Glyoxylase I family protein n=1 Tax=Paramicrobacterium humi TaxID=640635 RepID=A0A1H4L439_9MICO|nr:VOC family protein [Microbacterium humi]SEB65530.1 glyoxylase I family protein [Microbacterium humi]
MTPKLRSIHHVTLTVSDVDASLAWFRDVLGFEELAHVEQNGLDKAIMTRDGLTVSFVSHGDKAIVGDFTERRVGLDHLSFGVAEDELESWQEHLRERGVTQSPIVKGLRGRVLSFRGPDDIALEFYTVP